MNNIAGYLSNGEVFDSSLEASRGGFPFVFNVGMGQVIKGALLQPRSSLHQRL